jgi:hypothetical protein
MTLSSSRFFDSGAVSERVFLGYNVPVCVCVCVCVERVFLGYNLPVCVSMCVLFLAFRLKIFPLSSRGVKHFRISEDEGSAFFFSKRC